MLRCRAWRSWQQYVEQSRVEEVRAALQSENDSLRAGLVEHKHRAADAIIRKW